MRASRHRQKFFGLVALLGLLLGGCGSSSSSSGTERSQLLNRIQNQFQSSSFQDPDLAHCVAGQLSSLSTPQLRTVANSGPNVDPKTKHQVFTAASSCVSQGHGAAAMHAAIARGVTSQASSSTPPAMVNCILKRANAIPNAQLAQFVSAAEGGQLAAQAKAKEMGAGLARQCLQDPKLLSLLRGKFLAPIQSGLNSSKFSAAFRNCVLQKAEGVPASQLQQMALDPAGANARGQALGRGWAQQCIASGAKP